MLERIEPTIVRQKAYYGRRLLELGPLRYSEFREITGWAPEVCQEVLRHMHQKKIARPKNGIWSLRS